MRSREDKAKQCEQLAISIVSNTHLFFILKVHSFFNIIVHIALNKLSMMSVML